MSQELLEVSMNGVDFYTVEKSLWNECRQILEKIAEDQNFTFHYNDDRPGPDQIAAAIRAAIPGSAATAGTS